MVNAARAADIIRGGESRDESRGTWLCRALGARRRVSREADRNTETSTRVVDVFSPAVTGRARVSRVKRRTAQESDIEAPAKKRFFLETTGRRRKKGGALRARVRGKRRHATRGGAVHQGNDVSYAVRTSHHDARDERRDARDALRRLEAPPMPGNVRGGAWRRAPRGRRRAAFSTRARHAEQRWPARVGVGAPHASTPFNAAGHLSTPRSFATAPWRLGRGASTRAPAAPSATAAAGEDEDPALAERRAKVLAKLPSVCPGCGVGLQCEDKNLPGFFVVPERMLREEEAGEEEEAEAEEDDSLDPEMRARLEEDARDGGVGTGRGR